MDIKYEFILIRKLTRNFLSDSTRLYKIFILSNRINIKLYTSHQFYQFYCLINYYTL